MNASTTSPVAAHWTIRLWLPFAAAIALLTAAAPGVRAQTVAQAAAANGSQNLWDNRPESHMRREREQQRMAQRVPEQESIGQRALREQAQRERGEAMPPPARPWGHDSIWQARREQQQLQHEQQRLQWEQTREADRQQRRDDESIGQRALREAAARDREAARQQAGARQQQQRAGQNGQPSRQ